ncbi:TspO/MBR family protein [Lentilactobacillus sp. SPB1-3]|uniref:TspO/MBR family protein n=1 Tax=Lentilactobacillus terminaliae TaxID=3003483 RepID=A0ACD5DBU3_9LACO|nr:TspO/MBR family protein [Lentilactobacillus sp. SPB1-3]MCZ0977128.1 tryptophan-rich sensory protein [Lentilactobacillus sp. SPB1-3]
MNDRVKINYLKMIGFIIGVEILGFCSSLLSGNIREIYNGLALPPFSPPGPLFGIVWPILYVLLGISGYLFWIHRNISPTDNWLFWIQLVLNLLWTIIFFNFAWFWIGVLIILTMDGLTIKIIIQLNRGKLVLAKWLMVPYLLWILFATYLAIGVAILN